MGYAEVVDERWFRWVLGYIISGSWFPSSCSRVNGRNCIVIHDVKDSLSFISGTRLGHVGNGGVGMGLPREGAWGVSWRSMGRLCVQ